MTHMLELKALKAVQHNIDDSMGHFTPVQIEGKYKNRIENKIKECSFSPKFVKLVKKHHALVKKLLKRMKNKLIMSAGALARARKFPVCAADCCLPHCFIPPLFHLFVS
jgi:hypothetical protein